MATFTPEKFLDFVINYRVGNPNQTKGLLKLAQELIDSKPELMSDGAEWVEDYRAKLPAPSVLNVPYFSQRDNYTDASRTCFSSSCAMLLEFMKPGTLPGAKGDDKYLKKVFSVGDTVYPAVQVQALDSFGLKTSFTASATFAQLDAQLRAGKPVPIGILHKGPANAPSGGGHWITVIGKVDDAKAPGGAWYIVHDPWGEIDNTTGTYVSQNGKSLKYSRNLLKSRWTVEGDGSGYAILA